LFGLFRLFTVKLQFKLRRNRHEYEKDEDSMSAEDFYASLKKTAEDIQNLRVLD
jgi:hypothetical protein